jgi:predicted dehydrogenase
MGMANDRIRIALIGAGGMGQGDARDAAHVPGVEIAAAADIYDSRLDRMKELYPGIATTRDYRQVLVRKDIDAVIVATPDHWHAQITLDALAAGKDVYCEKPMVQKIEDGKRVIEAAKRSGRIFQMGSQYASAHCFEKIGQLLQSGAIGELNMVEAWLDRNTATGAWQYSIPPDASPQNIDWDAFLGSAPKRPFEPIRLFRWRNYRDYGTAVAGDLYVHLFTGLHTATGALGPTRIYSTGGLRYWDDGRETPDMQMGVIQYEASARHPRFQFVMRVNFKSSKADEDFGYRFIGSEGSITTDIGSVTLSRVPREKEPGHTADTFSRQTGAEYMRAYHEKYPVAPVTTSMLKRPTVQRFTSPRDAHELHMRNFIEALRTRRRFFEDAEYGFRATGPALLCNLSYSESRVCHWDAATMTAS